MKKYKITYHMWPEKDIEMVILARSEEEAIIFAKEYRNGSFSVEEYNTGKE